MKFSCMYMQLTRSLPYYSIHKWKFDDEAFYYINRAVVYLVIIYLVYKSD